jgi:hypothetical protein
MFYVLSSHNIYALERQFKTLPIEDTTVIVNTVDVEYLKKAVGYCNSIGVRVFVTPSDGSAATGKNSFLDRFDVDGVPYAVLIDGDDYLTARGVKFYKNLAKHSNPPDAVVLKNAVSQTWSSDKATNECLMDPKRQHADPSKLPFRMSLSTTVVDWEELKKGDLVCDMDIDFKPSDVDNFIQYAGLMHYGMGLDSLAARVVFMSRKALSVRYKKELIVGEDTFQYLELKDLHEKGEITLVSHNENRPTYIYDVRLSGIATEQSQKNSGQGFLDWMLVLMNKIQELKDLGKLHSTGIEEWHTV